MIHRVEFELHSDDCNAEGWGGEEQIRDVTASWTRQKIGKTEFQMSSPRALEWSSLVGRIYHCGCSRYRCLYTTRDARKQGEWAVMRQMTVSWMQDPLKAFSFTLKKKSPFFPSSKYREQTSTTYVSCSRWLFCWALSYDVRNFVVKVPAALGIAATPRNTNVWDLFIAWVQLMITEELAMGMLQSRPICDQWTVLDFARLDKVNCVPDGGWNSISWSWQMHHVKLVLDTVVICNLTGFRRGWTEFFRLLCHYVTLVALKPTFRE